MPRFCVHLPLVLLAALALGTAQAHAATSLAVDDTGDAPDVTPGDGSCATAGAVCTLRAAIEEANAAGEEATITFAIAGSGVHTITAASKLPAITVPTVIDGFSQAGAVEATEDTPAELTVELRSGMPNSGDPDKHGLEFAAGADSSVVGGLAIGGFRGYAVRIAADNVVVRGMSLGLAADGVTAVANRLGGVGIDAATDTWIGGAVPGDRNVLSANAPIGAGIVDDGGTGTNITGNFVGPDESGSAVPNDGLLDVRNAAGIVLNGASDAAIADNVISGNNGNGVTIDGGGEHRLTNNTIGLVRAENALLSNTLSGVTILGSPANDIGGEGQGDGNVISGNATTGVSIIGAASAGTEVYGNHIGVDGTGKEGDDGAQTPLGNRGDGIAISGAPGTRVGTQEAGNVIGMNGWTGGFDGAGVSVKGAAATDTRIQGNVIGLDADASIYNRFGNQGSGVRIEGAPGVLIGGPVNEGNVIADSGYGLQFCCKDNAYHGEGTADVAILGAGAAGTRIQGNLIGTDGSGTVPRGALGHGIMVGPGVPDTLIGGDTPDAGNLIANTEPTVDATLGGADGIYSEGPRTTIKGNLLGTDVNGTAVTGFDKCAVVLGKGAAGSVVGGTSPGERNVIAGAGNDAVELAADDVEVRGNYLGLTRGGRDRLGNRSNGVQLVQGAARTLIEGNVVSASTQFGIKVGDTAVDAVIRGNRIGTDAFGEFALGNLAGGIMVEAGATGTVVGGEGEDQGNVVSGNFSSGVIVGADGTTLLGNRIGTDATGTHPIPNVLSGVRLDASDTVVGDIRKGAGNVIRFNRRDGVTVISGRTGNGIWGNTIDDNRELAIDLTAGDPADPTSGVTPNDTLDEDDGANGLLNFPVLTSVRSGAAGTEVRGMLSGTPNTTFSIDAYASPQADASGHGEARTYLGTVFDVRTDAKGEAAFVLRSSAAASGVVAATATADDAGSTSELSKAMPVGAFPAGGGPAPAPPAATPGAGTTAPQASGPSRRSVLAALRGALRPSGLRQVLSARGWSATFAAPGPGGVRIDWRVTRGSWSLVVARGKAAFTNAGRVVVRMKLTKEGRRYLRSRSKARIAAFARFSGPDQEVTAARAFTIRR